MYQLTDTTAILRTIDGAYIPADLDNRDYAEYLAWLAQGNEAEPYVPPSPAPITRLSARDYLKRFTMSEYAAARSGTIEVQYALDNLISAQYVDLDDPDVAAGLDVMVQEGIINESRKAELLSPPAAE